MSRASPGRWRSSVPRRHEVMRVVPKPLRCPAPRCGPESPKPEGFQPARPWRQQFAPAWHGFTDVSTPSHKCDGSAKPRTNVPTSRPNASSRPRCEKPTAFSTPVKKERAYPCATSMECHCRSHHPSRRCASRRASAVRTNAAEVSGTRVPSNAWPTGAAITIDAIVATEVMIDAASPAMWPIGSMAIALMFPSAKPAS